MSFYECPKCGGVPGISFCCTDAKRGPEAPKAAQASEPVFKTITFDDKLWQLVPRTPSSKTICMMAMQIKGPDADGAYRTDGEDWPKHVAAAEHAYETALAYADMLPADDVTTNADLLTSLTQADTLRLHMGEMTPQELRAARAAVRLALFKVSQTQTGARIKALEAEVEMLRNLCAEAYQVVGVLSDDCGRFDDEQVQKVMDNLSQQQMVHDDVLPFASIELSAQHNNKQIGWEFERTAMGDNSRPRAGVATARGNDRAWQQGEGVLGRVAAAADATGAGGSVGQGAGLQPRSTTLSE